MFVTSAKLAALPGIRHAFFTRQGGVSQGIYASLNSGLGSQDPAENIAENRRRMAESLGLTPDRLIGCYQIHSPDIFTAEAPYQGGERPKADGVATRLPGLACCASAADCGPVLFADPIAKVVAAAHAGWKGAIGGVLENAIARIEALGGQRSRIIAAIGPLIRQPSYEVGEDFRAQFIAKDPAYAAFFIPRSNRAMPCSTCPASSPIA